MRVARRYGWLRTILLLVAAWSTSGSCFGQAWGLMSRFELSDSVALDEATSVAKTHLERVKAFLATEQWDEAIETLRQVMENDGDKVTAVNESRYISIRDYCHLQIATLPPSALQLYRDRVDPQAAKWLQAGLANRDADMLLQVVDRLFCSRWGDDALFALGELALERGDFGAARGFWDQLIPPSLRSEAAPTWLAYPDSDIPLVDVYARLVLVSILEGSRELAGDELKAFRERYGDATGRLGGREVNYAEMLTALLETSGDWETFEPSSDWATFGGSPERNAMAASSCRPDYVAWRFTLPKAPAADGGGAGRVHLRVAETSRDLLSYHPLILGDMVLVNSIDRIWALSLTTGQPYWADDDLETTEVDWIYESPRPSPDPVQLLRNSLGTARFTMTAHNGKLYARMGDPRTASQRDPLSRAGAGYLVCLDLASQGYVVWTSQPPGDGELAFEGAPIVDGENVYVALRRSDVRPQAHVACYDAETGKLRWTRFICGAETPAQGQADEITHNLLTLHHDTLYYNTNLGAVAAIAARDGHVKWVSLYPRATRGDLIDPPRHFFRDLTPCVYDQGTLFVASSDCELIRALDAATGMVHWETDLADDVVHLLGVADGELWACGHKLWAINALSGMVKFDYPDSDDRMGRGRGVLAGGKVYWPVREELRVFDIRTHELIDSIDLLPLSYDESNPVVPGNLSVAGGYLLIATSHELIALGPLGEPPETHNASNRVGRARFAAEVEARLAVRSDRLPRKTATRPIP